MSYSSDSFLKPIGSDKSIKFYDNSSVLTYTVKPTFITDVIDEVNLLKVILKSGKEINLDFINTDEPILAKSILLEQISTLLQTNDYVDNSQTITSYTTAPYSYNTFLRPISDNDRNIKIIGIDLVIKYTIDPFKILNTSIYGNILKINLKSNKVIILEFSTSNESKLAILRLKEQIDILSEKTPLTIDKSINNYIDSKMFSGPEGPVIEKINTSVTITSLVTYDFSTSDIWYHGTASTNYTANFTNLPITDGVVTSTIIISQGTTGYSPNVILIEGVAQSVKWAGGTYSTSTNKVDVVGFTFIRSAGSWTQVLAQINSFS